MLLSEIVEDLCLQTPLGNKLSIKDYCLIIYIYVFTIDIMHQEELGLLKKEITLLYENLEEAKQILVDSRLSKMPKVKGFPTPSRSLKYAKHFQAKDWIAISKCIVYVIEGNLKLCVDEFFFKIYLI